MISREDEAEYRCRPKCNGKGFEKKNGNTQVRDAFLALVGLEKRYDALGNSGAINQYMMEQVPKIQDADLVPYVTLRDEGKGWSAVTQDLEAAQDLVRMGMQGLYGCNIIVAVSDKMVYMGTYAVNNDNALTDISVINLGHYVEETGFDAKDLDKVERKKEVIENDDGEEEEISYTIDFKKNVLDAISAPSHLAYPTLKSKENLLRPGAGRRRANFLKVFIITGREENGGPRLYPREVKRMQNEIQRVLGADAHVHEYEVLPGSYNQCNEAQKRKYDEQAVGMCMFEYDPNNNNNGQKSWRLLVHGERVDEGNL